MIQQESAVMSFFRRYLKPHRAVLTCSQRYNADGRLSADQFVPYSLQYTQHPANSPVTPTYQHPEPGDIPEGVEAAEEKTNETPFVKIDKTSTNQNKLWI